MGALVAATVVLWTAVAGRTPDAGSAPDGSVQMYRVIGKDRVVTIGESPDGGLELRGATSDSSAVLPVTAAQVTTCRTILEHRSQREGRELIVEVSLAIQDPRAACRKLPGFIRERLRPRGADGGTTSAPGAAARGDRKISPVTTEGDDAALRERVKRLVARLSQPKP